MYVLTHTKEMTYTPSDPDEMKKLKKKHYIQDQREIYTNDKTGNIEQQQGKNDIEELEMAESG